MRPLRPLRTLLRNEPPPPPPPLLLLLPVGPAGGAWPPPAAAAAAARPFEALALRVLPGFGSPPLRASCCDGRRFFSAPPLPPAADEAEEEVVGALGSARSLTPSLEAPSLPPAGGPLLPRVLSSAFCRAAFRRSP